MFSLFNRDKAKFKFNRMRRDVRNGRMGLNVIGRVVFVGRAVDKSGNWDRKTWSLEDNVVICFMAGGEYYRGLIRAIDLALCGFNPNYGQKYRFTANSVREMRENYVLVPLSEVLSV